MRSYVEIIWIVGIIIAVATVIIHFVFAAAVLFDAVELNKRDGLKPALVPGPIWALATLIFGPLVGIGYWIIHRSTVTNRNELDKSEPEIEDYLA